MRFLLNASSIVKGGGAQRSASFIRELAADPRGHEWCIAHTSAQDEAVQRCDDRVEARRFDERPSRSRQVRSALLALEDQFQPDCIYTIGGPAYVKFRRKHLMSVADGWVTHSTWLAYETLSFPRDWLQTAAICLYKAFWLWQADAWVIQTESARQALHRRLRVPLQQITVIPNTCATLYLDQPATPYAWGRGEVRILYFTAPYPHKRIEFIPRVAQRLKQLLPQRRFRFVLTLPPDCPTWQRVQGLARRLDVVDCFENVGPVAFTDGPQLYRDCHLCFLPTVLETFSASYPEAMAMLRPMVTSDLGFARDVCGPAASYFSPRDPDQAAAQLARVIEEPHYSDQLIRSGQEVLSQLPTATQQYHAQVNLLESLAQRTSKAGG